MDERNSTDGLCRRIMEQRTNLRLAVRVPAEVRLAAGVAVRGELRDASFEGAYVRVAHTSRVVRDCGRLLLPAAGGEHAPMVDIPVLVVRSDDAGIGLMFGDYDAPAEQGLRCLFNDSFSKR